MIILDTNIVSEMMKTSPSVRVIHWLNSQSITQLFVTTLTIAEISYGLQVLSNGKKRHALEIAFEKTINEAFKHRILSFDEPAAHLYGEIMAKRKKAGRPLSLLDGQIAAIALTNSATLATRNLRDFSSCNLNLVNPFDE